MSSFVAVIESLYNSVAWLHKMTFYIFLTFHAMLFAQVLIRICDQSSEFVHTDPTHSPAPINNDLRLKRLPTYPLSFWLCTYIVYIHV